MPRKVILNKEQGETGLSSRTKINENFEELYAALGAVEPLSVTWNAPTTGRVGEAYEATGTISGGTGPFEAVLVDMADAVVNVPGAPVEVDDRDVEQIGVAE